MHILVLYQYFQNPDAAGTGRHYSFVRAWAKRHRVTVVSARSDLSESISSRFPPVPEGARLKSFDIPYSNKMGRLQRFWAFQRFARKAVGYGTRMERPDVVFATSTPLSVGWAARKIAAHWGIPWVFEVRDLWPDFPIEMGAVPTAWLKARLRSFESDLYRQADHVVTLSTDMEQHVLRRGGTAGRITTLVNGTSFELLDETPLPERTEILRQEHGLKDRKVVLYAGSLGRANGIPVILDAARRLEHRDDIVFVFIGSGYAYEDVVRAATNAANVIALEPVPKHEIYAWHALADLSLVTFIDRPVLASNSPSKFFDSLSCGTPVLVTNPGWTRRFVEDHDCGWWIPRLEPAELASKLTDIADRPDRLVEKGRHGMSVARAQFDRSAMADRLETIMIDLVAKSAPV